MILNIGDNSIDGVTWFYASKTLLIPWQSAGGDWLDATDTSHGPTPWITLTQSSFTAGLKELSVPVALIDKLRTDNSGLHIRRVSGPTIDIANRNHLSLPHPSLSIETSDGTFDCPCIQSQWIDLSAGNPIQGTVIKNQGTVKFDVSEVTGTTVGATLGLYVAAVFAGTLPSVLHINYLDLPQLITDPVAEIGTIETGLAQTVDHDTDLAGLVGPTDGVFFYADFPDLATTISQWNGLGAMGASGELLSSGGAETAQFVTWPEHGGMKAVRVEGSTLGPRISAFHALVPPANPSYWWKANWGSSPHTDLYFRLLLMIDPDVIDGMVELGVKLPGFSGTYEFTNQDVPDALAANWWSGRMEHGKYSPANGSFRYYWYWYGADWPYPNNPSNASPRLDDGVLHKICLVPGRKYCFEQRVKLNTVVGGVGQNDGILEHWIDGVKWYSKTGVAIRTGDDKIRYESVPFLNIYHGGNTAPIADIHYEVAGVVVANRYIGPPKATVTPPADPEVTMLRVQILDEATGKTYAGYVSTTALPAPPPVDCELSEWSDWVDIGNPSPCVDGEQTQTQQRTRTVITEPSNGGAACGPLVETQQVTLSCTPPPDPGLPSYVPEPGTFAEFTLNIPTDAGVQAEAALLANWCGGALVDDYSAHGGVAYQGGREHFAYTDRGGVLVLDIENRVYELTNVPSAGAQTSAILNANPSGSLGVIAQGSGATMASASVANLAGSPNLASIVVGQSVLNLAQATNAEGKQFLITAFDNTAKTVTVSGTPTGITSSGWNVYAPGTSCTVSGSTVQLAGNPNLTGVITSGPEQCYITINSAVGTTAFPISAVDNTAKTATVVGTPTGFIRSTWSISGHWIGAATNDWGAFANNDYPQRTHTYNGIQQMPAAWGGGEKGSIVMLHSGGASSSKGKLTTPPSSAEGNAAMWRFDLSQATDGVDRLTGDSTYFFGTKAVSTVNDAPSTGIDMLREGWWGKARGDMGEGNRFVFTSKTGVITSYPTPLIFTSWAQIHHFDDEDLLVLIGGGGATVAYDEVYVLQPPDVNPSDTPTKVVQTGTVPKINPHVGRMGMRWCSHANVQAFLGIKQPGSSGITEENWIDSTHIRIWILTPPAVGRRRIDPWVWTTEIVASGDGSQMASNDHALANGSHGKLVYCSALKSLVWTRAINQKGQLIRLSSMT